MHKVRHIGRFLQFWELKEEHQQAVLERLEGIYGDTNKKTEFTDMIKEIASRIAQDCYGELASDIEYLKEGSFLEELDELNIAGAHYNALKRESETQDVQPDTQTGNAGERGNNDVFDLREERGLLNLKITYTYSLLIHCLQIPRRNQTI